MIAEKPDPAWLEKHLTTKADNSLMSDRVYHLSFTWMFNHKPDWLNPSVKF